MIIGCFTALSRLARLSVLYSLKPFLYILRGFMILLSIGSRELVICADVGLRLSRLCDQLMHDVFNCAANYG